MSSPGTAKHITQRDVADSLGLSQATVSFALRDDPKIPTERRLKIQEHARAMGYRPSPAASTLAHMRHASRAQSQGDVIGFINLWPVPSDLHALEEFDGYYKGAKNMALRLGYKLDEFKCGKDISPQRLESILKARGIQGVLLPPHPYHHNLKEIDWAGFSLIRFGRSLVYPLAHTVSPDQAYNTTLAFNEILAKGYKRIGFVSGGNPYWLFDSGFLKARRQVPESDRLPIFDFYNKKIEDVKAPLAKWIKDYRPDAIITPSREVPSLVTELGFKVPEDIGIAVCSVLDGGADSGIDQNPLEIGKVGVLSLISLLHDNDIGIPELFREILVKGTWVDGSSLPSRI